MYEHYLMTDISFREVVALVAVVAVGAVAVLVLALALREDEEPARKAAPALKRDPRFDSVQENPAIPFKIVCTGYSNRPKQPITGEVTYTKKMIGFRVRSDCKTVALSAAPKGPKLES